MAGLHTLTAAANIALSISILALTISSVRNGRRPAHGRSWLFFAAASCTLVVHALFDALDSGSSPDAGIFEVATIALLGAGFVLLYGADRDEIRSLHASSQRDQLTQLFNLSTFRAIAGTRIAASIAHGRSSAVGILDLDEFKSVNDTFGHAAGDRTLQLVATAIRASLRASDVAGRYGGDEFVVLLDGCDSAGAERILHRIRHTLVALSAAAGEPVSLSAGVACFPECGSTIDGLVGRADEALLLAKRAGKNGVRLAAHPGHNTLTLRTSGLEPAEGSGQ